MALLPKQAPVAGAPIRRPAWWRIYGFLSGLLVLVTLVLLPANKVAAYSVLLGGLIVIVPNAWFARMVFRWQGARQARAILLTLYSGEAGKFVITAVLFAAVFAAVEPLRVIVLFAAYLATLLLHTVLVARLGARVASHSGTG